MAPKHFLESGTLWAMAILAAVDGITRSGLIELLPPGAQDIWAYVVAFVAILMRLKTAGGVTISKPKPPAD